MRLCLYASFLGASFLGSGLAQAANPLYDSLVAGNPKDPLVLMAEIETEQSGIISQFDIDFDDGELHYEFDLINPAEDSLTELTLRASDGKLLLQKVNKLEADDQDELAAVKLLQQKELSFSALVTMAVQEQQGKLIEAQLEHDLGISYLEFKLMDENGKRKLAFDINKLKPLPMLTWE
ncbi:hypothetical protein JYB88_17815 [Shewanella cyperi]|uniref:PepSY domain-containing protein n=1 Tax=Shewanella cyperi TaxID=2814292 RepID=A0A974XKD4_9GAMM|nr:hypothetical protein [Shewanella cyperi]QSX30006.1 hypothetical protein JYB88_17815 [Shewanella cyperi]